ncbi:hypothetical protein PILCRDRAFT_566 [Piloderma croceum F 1598]|uniref:Uncharacterized protein n=1 Tax=Piloderma croceum (strain F 1598) TaxID=765440 RepID=A0A0C3BXR9_PILCF|nr:hypothetical protein PILCRDRAFT_566 [Piloderma croceum F 1598]
MAAIFTPTAPPTCDGCSVLIESDSPPCPGGLTDKTLSKFSAISFISKEPDPGPSSSKGMSDSSPTSKHPSVRGNGVRGSNIDRGGVPPSRGQAAAQAGLTLARPSNAPKKTMEQLLAGIMAASGPTGTPSPPCPQPKNNYSTTNDRIVVTDHLDKSGVVPLSKSDGKKKEQVLQLLEAEEAQDEAAAKQNKVNKRRSKEAYAKKQRERRAAKRVKNQQKSRSPIKAAQTQVQHL